MQVECTILPGDPPKTAPATPESVLGQLNGLGPEKLLAWAYATQGDRAAIVTSFQDTGCVLIDMAQRVAPGLRIATVDTLRLHQETYNFITRMEKRYGIIIERFKPDPARLAQMIAHHGEYLFFDSQAKQEYCCQIRKVEPNARILASLDVWISGLRRDQSSFRESTQKAAFVNRDGRRIVRLCPLADWTEERIRDYMRVHGVLHNPLYDKGYTSIGCEICTTPTLPSEGKRAGRWRWFNYLGNEHKKECGIHTQGDGI